MAACLVKGLQWRECQAKQLPRGAFALLISREAAPHLLNVATFLWITSLVCLAAATTWWSEVPPMPNPSSPLVAVFTAYYAVLALSSGVTRHGYQWSLLWRALARHISAALVLPAWSWACLGGAVPAGGTGSASWGRMGPQKSDDSSAGASRLQSLNNQGYSVLQHSLQCAADLVHCEL
jgi:hypothetical protein